MVGMAKPPRSGLFRLQVVAAVLSVFLAGGHAAARSLSDDEASLDEMSNDELATLLSGLSQVRG